MRAALLAAMTLAVLAPLPSRAQEAPGTPAPAPEARPAVGGDLPLAPDAPPLASAEAPLAPAVSAPPPAPAPAPPPAPAAAVASRGGPYAGFSFGTGRGDVFVGNTTTAVNDLVPGTSPTTLALMLRFGWGSGDLLFGVQANLVRSQWDEGGSSSAMQLTGVDLVATWRAEALGLYLRAGAGPAKLTFEGGGSSESWDGTEAMLGIGFTTGGFGVGIDYVRQNYADGAPIDGAGYMLATLSLDLG